MQKKLAETLTDMGGLIKASCSQAFTIFEIKEQFDRETIEATVNEACDLACKKILEERRNRNERSSEF